MRLLAALRACGVACWVAAGFAEEIPDELLSLSWEELNAQEISTLTRKRASLDSSPVAAFVVTAEDIRRSGARTLPDILRMVPGLQVAAINGWDQAVTARGMNGFYANKLLVMMDGRSLYNPFIGGVWWGDQNPFLEDIARIEVLRGPGGSLWGANAFNGVINIVTKRAGDTQGGLVVAGGGSEERAFGGARYGFRVGEEGYLRLFANALDRDATARPGGGDAYDSQRAQHGGFRLDLKPSERDRVTVQGEAAHNNDDWLTRTAQLTPPYDLIGPHTTFVMSANLLGRWSHRQDDGGETTLAGYLDYSHRDWPAVGEEHLTFDLDFQQRLAPWGRHDVMWGAGYRHIVDSFNNTLLFSVLPSHAQQDNFSAFVQDEIRLADTLVLTLGSKFEHYTLAGFQAEPNIRLSWTPNPEHNLWLAVSRAVALPTRYQRDFKLTIYQGLTDNNVPSFGALLGSRAIGVETVIAYELGWRYTPTPRLKLDTALFYNHYEDALAVAPVSDMRWMDYAGFPVYNSRFTNLVDIDSYGVELAADYAMTKTWRWKLAYTAQGMDEDSGRLATVPVLMRYQRTQPRHTLSLRTSLDVRDDVEFDLWLRHAGAIMPGGVAVPAYLTLDARLAWQVTPVLELALVGRNLLDPRHPEFSNYFYMPYPSELERGVYAKATLRF